MEDIVEDHAGRTGRAQQRLTATRKVLEAAVSQLALEGVRGLTHRKVEDRAGLAQGSVKYYFGSSESLLEAVLTHLADQALPLVLVVAPVERADAASGGAAALLQRAGQVAEAMLARPEEVRARMHLYLHAASRPRLRALVTAERDRFVAAISESLPGPGSEAAARFVCAVVDGILLDQVSAPHSAVEQNAARYLVAAGAAALEMAAEPGD